jgi:hypothetical protein
MHTGRRYGTLAWVLGGVIVVAAAFIAGDLVDPFERAGVGSPTPADDTEPPTEDPTETPTPEPTQDPDDPNSYFTTDGTSPAMTPECSGAMGLCIGNPIDRAIDTFGPEDERFEGQQPGWILRAWNTGDIRLVVEADDVGSITSVSVSIPDRRTDVRVALPEGLVLGADTMDDVANILGEPFRRDDFAAENVWLSIYVYVYGPEGIHELSFTHSNEGGPVRAAELGGRRITGFSAEYAG